MEKKDLGHIPTETWHFMVSERMVNLKKMEKYGQSVRRKTSEGCIRVVKGRGYEEEGSPMVLGGQGNSMWLYGLCTRCFCGVMGLGEVRLG